MGAHPLCEDAERRMREILESEGLEEPDGVEYDEASIVLLWHTQKLAVVIDLPDLRQPPS